MSENSTAGVLVMDTTVAQLRDITDKRGRDHDFGTVFK